MRAFSLCVYGWLAVLLMLPVSIGFAQDRTSSSITTMDARVEGWVWRSLELRIALDDSVIFTISQVSEGVIHIDLDNVAVPDFDAIGYPTSSVLRRIRAGRIDEDTLRLIVETEYPVTLDSSIMLSNDEFGELTLNFDIGRGRLPVAVVELDVIDNPLPLIMLDPGHGGIDPGPVRDGYSEKDIVLAFGIELRDALLATGRYDVMMTRDTDRFINLRERVRMARTADADAFLSLHTNIVIEGNATGAAVYTLSNEASSREAAALAVLENRSDTIGGEALSVGDDDLALVLTDMAQRQTNTRSTNLADALVEGLDHSVGVIRSNPHRSAGFRVLKAPDIPSVLIELGFLSDPGDRADMLSSAWRAQAVEGVIAGLDDWVERDRLAARLAGQ